MSVPRILNVRIIEADTGCPCFQGMIIIITIIAAQPRNEIKTIRRARLILSTFNQISTVQQILSFLSPDAYTVAMEKLPSQ